MSCLYQPLDAAKKEIRLLKLYPRNDPRYTKSQEDVDGQAQTAALVPEMGQLMAEVQASFTEDGSSAISQLQRDELAVKMQMFMDKLQKCVLSPIEGPLEGALETVSLDAAPEFTALSYVWGSASITKPFLLNGQLFNITSNLDDALRQLQSYNKEQLLWIDSLCIDQKSDADRSDQVSRMQSIYSTAPTAAIWLGEADEDIKFALEYIESQSEMFLEINKIMPRIKVTDVEPLLASNPSIRQFFESDARDRLEKGMNTLLNREYWYRVWVMQEFSVSKDVYIHCGDCKLPVQLLVSATVVINALLTAATGSIGRAEDSLAGYLDGSTRSIFTMMNPAAAFRMFVERQAYQLSNGNGSRLLSSSIMLFEAGYFETQALRATDPRDKIYALLGIAQDKNELGIPIDYSKSVEQVYTQATAMILGQKHFDFLQICTFAPDPNWPSWVPDLRRDVQLTPNNVMSMQDKPFRASGKVKPARTPVWLPEDPRTISMEGIRVDTIAEIGLPIMGQQVEQTMVAELVRRFTHQADAFLATGLSINELYRSQQQKEYGENKAQWITETRIRLLTADIEYEDLMQGSKNRATSLTQLRFAKLLEVVDGYDAIMADPALTPEERPTKFWALANPRMGYFDMYLFGMQMNVNRKLFRTANGFVGLAPQAAEIGDEVVIFVGANLPYTLRRAEDGTSFRLIGDTYVQGIMDGEFMRTKYQVETIDLT